METKRLSQFCTISETQNMRAAAEILHLTHSALSKSMKVLQDELGIKLLQQNGRGIQITDEGQEFYKKAKKFLEAEKMFLGKSSKDNPKVRIGTFEVFSTYLLPGTWAKYFNAQELELYEMLPGRMESALVKNQIDIGITYAPIPTAGVDFLKVGRVRIGIFSRSGIFEKMSLDEISFAAPISPIDAIPTGPKGLDGWPDDEFPRQVKYRVDMLESGLALARTGQSAIFIPKFLARLHNEVSANNHKLIEISHEKYFKPIFRTIYLIKRKSTSETKTLKKIAQLIRQECFED
jgi:DNA-binding transcriptional LysR family regulator